MKDLIVKAHISGNANKREAERGQVCLGCDLQKQLNWKIPVLAGTGEMVQNKF